MSDQFGTSLNDDAGSNVAHQASCVLLYSLEKYIVLHVGVGGTGHGPASWKLYFNIKSSCITLSSFTEDGHPIAQYPSWYSTVEVEVVTSPGIHLGHSA
jgi:hypothetical protein